MWRLVLSRMFCLNDEAYICFTLTAALEIYPQEMETLTLTTIATKDSHVAGKYFLSYCLIAALYTPTMQIFITNFEVLIPFHGFSECSAASLAPSPTILRRC